jgi:hypothetical protein
MQTLDNATCRYTSNTVALVSGSTAFVATLKASCPSYDAIAGKTTCFVQCLKIIKHRLLHGGQEHPK